MGRTLQNKKEIVTELKDLLSDTQSIFVIDYKGLTVGEISDLRNRIRDKGGTCKIAKNTLIRIAVQDDDNWQPVQGFLKDATALLLTQEDIGGVIKEYKKFQKDTKKTELRGGVLEGKALTKTEAEALADLPSKEELYAKIAGALNALATKVAVGVKEVPSSIARGLQAYADKEGGEGGE
ncbi:50S ribosomal protein L10 [Leptolyngbya cf. ectocarpi LEGE 11479]|uniref:Large ribosomal subunit protein uL10 n=1 Tax=Leptolyngbya cf. ectocarpi LEGE 11479 TaxID=1828722 RepID=A0A928ZYB9_LEPEC|nr:50S ribosomal protein L10 [Leptolyngbya ectocarpi]MBE9069754.1 50S ribosomal protein L10 [Leptolyngbya cf. ectocarpi LEGE 11479]